MQVDIDELIVNAFDKKYKEITLTLVMLVKLPQTLKQLKIRMVTAIKTFNSHLNFDKKPSYADFSHHKSINHEHQEKPYTISSPRR